MTPSMHFWYCDKSFEFIINKKRMRYKRRFFGSEISVAITERKSSNSKFLSRCNKIILFELYRTSKDFGEPGKMFAKVSM